MARVVVIGAGVSGLAVAARLARFRHDVLVLERAEVPGGQAGRYERDGFAFDTGPTLLHLPATYRDLFIKTGKTAPLESVLELEPVDPALRWHFADGTTVDLPNASRAGTMEAISAALGPDAARQWDAYLAAGGDLWATFRQGFLGPPAPPPKRPWWKGAARPATVAVPRLQDERLRDVEASYAARIGADPMLVDDTVAVWPAMEHTFGTWRPVGGIRRLVDVIVDRAVLRGAELRFGTEVAAITATGGAVTGVRLTDGADLPADLVIAAVDDRVLASLTGGAVEFDRKRSASMVTMLLALRGEESGPPTLLLPPDDDGLVLHLSPASAPPGHAAWTVTAPAHPHPHTLDMKLGEARDWDAPGHREATEARILTALDRRGLDVTDRLLWSHLQTPADLDRAGLPGGSLTGPVWHGRRGRHRPPNETEVRGLFHIGAATHPGPGIDFAPLSAALVADAIGRNR